MRLILVLGDQLSDDLAALRAADPGRDLVVMAEVMAEAQAVPHHPQKIALVLAAMRKFADHLRARGFAVAYSRLDDPATGPSLPAELLRRMAESGADQIIATMPGDWRLFSALQDAGLPLRFLPDDRFICPAVATKSAPADLRQPNPATRHSRRKCLSAVHRRAASRVLATLAL